MKYIIWHAETKSYVCGFLRGMVEITRDNDRAIAFDDEVSASNYARNLSDDLKVIEMSDIKDSLNG